MKKTSSIFFLLFLTTVSFGQITLTVNDIGNVGDQIISSSQNYSGDTPPDGPMQTYSFPESDTSFQDTTNYISPASTPYAALMTGSNLAENNFGAYTFYTRNSTGYFLNGLVFDFPVDGLGLPFSEVPLKFTPPAKLLAFPATVGQNLTSQSTARFEFNYDTVISINGLNATVSKVGVVATLFDTSTIDGYGDAEFVSGSIPALRNLQTFKITFKLQVFAAILFFPPSWIDLPTNLLPAGGIPEIYQKSLQFWANGKKAPIAEMGLDSAGNVVGASYLKELLVTSNRSLVSVKKGFEFTPIPNPAQGFVSFKSEEKIKNISILSSEGKKIMDKMVSEGESGISVSNLASGIYLMELESNSGKISRKKLVINQ